MDRVMQRQRAEEFHRLHQTENPLVLFNVWDVATARAVAKSAPAVATSSGAVAAALGYPDGQQLPIDAVVHLVSRISNAVSTPISVDLEAGYGESPEAAASSVARIIAAGAVGINIEDGLSEGKRELVSAPRHAAKIAAVREEAERSGIGLFINARTDPFLLRVGSLEECFEEAVARAEQYRTAGADGIFVPGLTDLAMIAQLVKRVDLPINVMITSPTIAVSALAAVGVRRISLGPWPMIGLMHAVEDAAAALLKTGEFTGPLLAKS